MEWTPRRGHLLLIVALIGLSWCSMAAAHFLELKWYYLLDEAGSLTADAASAADLAAWKPLPRSDVNFGFSRATYWFRIPVPASLPAPSVLAIDNPHLDQVDFFQYRGGKLVAHHRGGSLQQTGTHSGARVGFSFPLLDVDEPTVVLLRVRSGGVLRVPISIVPAAGLQQNQYVRAIRWSAALGVLLALTVAHGLGFIRSRRTVHLTLAALVVTTAAFYMWLGGYVYLLFRLEPVLLRAQSVPMITAIAISVFGIAAFGLATTVYRPGRRSRAGFGVWLAMTAALIATTLLLPHWVSLRLVVPVGLVAIGLGIAVGMLIWRAGRYQTKSVAAAWLLFCMTVLLLAVAELGIPWGAARILESQPLPIVVALAALSLSIFVREQHAQSQLMARQAEVISRLRAARATQSAGAGFSALKERLTEREREVEALRAELIRTSSAHGTGVGTVEPRETFDRRYRTEWRRAYRNQSMLSLVLFEIDGFQTWVDAYGDAAAEQYMQKVAAAIQDHFRRPADLLARFSRSSFVVLTPSTSREDALRLAEGVRRAIETSTLEVTGLRRSLSLSAGIASMIPDARHHDAVLLSFADDALYQARAAGGNRVVCYQLPVPAAQSEQF